MNEPAVRLCYVHAIQYAGAYCPYCGPPGKVPLVPCGKMTAWTPHWPGVGTLVIPCQLIAGHGGDHVGLITVQPAFLHWQPEPESPPERENP
jgi:hypothetical protein